MSAQRAGTGALATGRMALVLSVAGIGCGGYDALEVSTRAFAPMEAALMTPPSRVGATLVELTVAPPEGVADFPWPWAVVGHPALQTAGGRVVAWARGPCDLPAGATPASGPPWVLCAAVRWDDGDLPPEPPLFTAVFESLATGQRVTFIGDTAASDAPEVP